MVGMETNTGGEKKRLPKIIDYDGISSDEEEIFEEDDYDLIKSSNEPYILFRRLGYFALDSNERANYKARELKSVRLDTEGEYIRLVARRCHTNHLNQYNQVGIVGIAVMGEPVDYLLAGESQKIPIEHADGGPSRVASPDMCIIPVIQDNHWMINGNPNDQRNFVSLHSILSDASPPENDGSATLSQPPQPPKKVTNPITSNDFLLNEEETAQLLAAFGRAKANAVKGVYVEDFHLAKVLKYAIELVTKAAEDAMKLESLKKQAVEEEDFDNAEKYKVTVILNPTRSLGRDIELLRDDIRNALLDEGLDLDDSGEVTVYDPQLADIIGLADDVIEETTKSRTSSNASVSRVNSSKGPSNGDSNKHQPMTPMTPSQWTPLADERPLPALSNSNSCQTPNNVPTDPFDDGPEDLSDLARVAFSLSIQYFGEYVVACMLSKKFLLRDSALVEVTKRVDINFGDGKDVEGVDKIALIKATFQIIQEAMNDNREKLTLATLTLWETLTVPIAHTWKLVEQNYELLFSKISDSNSRIKQSSTKFFCYLAKTYRNQNYSILALALKPAKTPNQPLKTAKAKVELVTKLVEEFGVSLNKKSKTDKEGGISLEAVMQLSVSYLNNNHGDVRESAVKLVVEIVKRAGREKVEGFISDIKPMLLETIWNLVTEYEEETGKVAGQVPSPPPSPKVTPKGLTEEEKEALKDFEVDETLLKAPLAKRGTMTRIEQQLMELRSMFNNTNYIIKDDYDTYIANSTKPILAPEDYEVGVEEVEKTKEPEPQPEPTKKSSTAHGSKSSTPASKSTKKPKADGQKTSTAKASKNNAPSKDTTSRTGSSGSARKVSVASATTCDEPEEISASNEAKGDRCCIFCDERNDRFTEDNLVTHYWNDCPVLTKCRLCNIILEISTLDDHMLTDCDKSRFVKQCPRCREVIDADDYLEHTAKQTCLVIRDDIVRCPLCKTMVKPATEAGWKAHLLDPNGCPKNRRKENHRSNAPSMVKEMEHAAAASSKRGEKRPSSKVDAPKTSSVASKTSSRSKLAASSGKDKVKKATTNKVSKVKK
ncbi:7736_t:CDS:10 [Acaulospora colombiana]|uniref:7736_t:CDS:1 n=1 Tax=Acaulospora colombiana TaxID=27376 RepID=A0ACA9K590_9GLOM|nr:7736_t:CDS:10 [Acaulospora colombiana]